MHSSTATELRLPHKLKAFSGEARPELSAWVWLRETTLACLGSLLRLEFKIATYHSEGDDPIAIVLRGVGQLRDCVNDVYRCRVYH